MDRAVHSYAKNTWPTEAYWKAHTAMALRAVGHFNGRKSDVVEALSQYDKATACPITLNGTL